MTASRLMLAFEGARLPARTAYAIRSGTAAGVTLFRHHNVESPDQILALTSAIQEASPPGAGPLLIATDQEGGQLNALGDGPTQFAGAMALGAAGDPDLARRVAQATGREMRALGVNVDYAPVCDLASNPANPSLGLRSFGDNPAAVAELVAATVLGLHEGGVAATLKHFPGAGDTAVDTHHSLAVVNRSDEQMRARELVPFRAGIAAGARLVMAGHFAIPGLTGDPELPASLARTLVSDILRDELGFDGLTITDALDMRALAQDETLVESMLAALESGQDLLLGTPDEKLLARMAAAVATAESRRVANAQPAAPAEARLTAVRSWLASFDAPPMDVVGSAEHARLAAELARRSLTMLRNDDRLLPLRLSDRQRLAVIHSPPADMTPADTSSTVMLTLVDALRRRHARTDLLLAPAEPESKSIASLRSALTDYDVVIVGTFAAHLQPAQADLAKGLLAAGRPTITVALRTPWDLAAYPASRTHVCSFGILAPTMEALAGALFGEHEFAGRLPVEIAGIYPRGHGLGA